MERQAGRRSGGPPGASPDAYRLSSGSWVHRPALAPAGSGSPQPSQDLVSLSRCATRGGHDTRRRECRLQGSQCKTAAKSALAGGRSGRKTRRMSWLYFTGSTRLKLNCLHGQAAQSRPFDLALKLGLERSGRAPAIVSPWRYRRWTPYPGRRAGSTGSKQQGRSPVEGLVTTVPGEPPCDGRGHRRRVDRDDAGHPVLRRPGGRRPRPNVLGLSRRPLLGLAASRCRHGAVAHVLGSLASTCRHGPPRVRRVGPADARSPPWSGPGRFRCGALIRRPGWAGAGPQPCGAEPGPRPCGAGLAAAPLAAS